ncbi:acetyl-CoA carboxylase carboxyl transferase subunit alpha, partial [Methylobacterium sp. WL122]
GDALAGALAEFDGVGADEIRDRRARKFLEIGRRL